jgi:hypothetical protein
MRRDRRNSWLNERAWDVPISERAYWEVVIDSTPLLELVRRAETGHVERENADRTARGLDEDESSFEPGGYAPFVGDLPSLFNPPLSDHGFVLDEDDPRRRKVALLECSCGNPGCWTLLVRVHVLKQVVVWSDFEQLHRDWLYDLGPFVFDTQQYVAALES